MPAPPEKRKALIVVRTYPTPAKKGAEVSCTAAITEDGQWMRLFPIPWRALDEEERFRKYQWVEVTVSRPRDDARPESYQLAPGVLIRILTPNPISTKDNWKARWDILRPLIAHCMCCLQNARDEHGFPTLGLFKPKTIQRLRIEPDDPDWSPEQVAILTQGHLWQKKPQKQLEKVPFKFIYDYMCDHPECKGHSMMCSDWEMGQSWRKWKRQYGKDWETAFRHKYETEMLEKNDTHFYVGTVRKHPGSWIIVGLFYPPKPKSSPSGWLFDPPS